MTVIRLMLLSAAKRVGALVLGGVFVWQVAENSGLRKGEAIVHVTESGVDVTIDDSEYRVETVTDSPIVCDLTAGRHTLRMARDGRVLYEESFTVPTNNDVVLTAWDKTRRRMTQPPPRSHLP
jgi:hypothetical protein